MIYLTTICNKKLSTNETRAGIPSDGNSGRVSVWIMAEQYG
jgi:hypothetical protein